jgi:hypothetical protein
LIVISMVTELLSNSAQCRRIRQLDSATTSRRLTVDAIGNPGAMIGQLRSVVVDCKDPDRIDVDALGTYGQLRVLGPRSTPWLWKTRD